MSEHRIRRNSSERMAAENVVGYYIMYPQDSERESRILARNERLLIKKKRRRRTKKKKTRRKRI